MSKAGQSLRRSLLKAAGAAATLGTWVPEATEQSGTGPYSGRSDEHVRIGNDQLELAFRRDNGGLDQVTSKRTQRPLLTDTPVPALTWGLRFYHPEYDNLMTASYLAGRPTIETSTDTTRAAVRLRWSEPQFKAPPNGRLDESFNGTIEVEASVAVDETISRWRLQVTNNGDRAIRQTICPQVTNIAPLANDGSDALYIPSRLGRKYPNPKDLKFSPVHRYPSGFGTMQFVTYLGDDTGMYAAAEDPDGYAKRLEFTSRNGVLGYRGTHLVPYQPGDDVAVPYEMTFGIHNGGWRAACDRYRSWVESEGWLTDTKPMVPDRLHNRGVSYHERSYTREAAGGSGSEPLSFETIESMVSNVQERLNVPMGFRWWGWEKHGRPVGGDWLPPYEGRDAFETTISSLEETGVDTIAMLSPTFLLESSDYWASLDQPSALPIKARDGTIRRYTGDEAGITLDKIAPTVQPWQDHYRGVLTELVSSGITHLDLDGTPWQWVPNCWNDAHDHPQGKGGNWFPQRLRQLYKKLHDTHNINGGLILGGEGIADFFLPYMNEHVIRDGMAEFDDPAVDRGLAEVVPMFPYAFGNYAATRSQKGHIGEFADQRNIQRLIAGRAVEWGSIPLFMGHYDPAPGDYDDALLEYYARIGAARAGYANRFLARGEMLTRPVIDRRTVTITQRGVETETEEIRGTGWRSPTGNLGIVLTNVSNRTGSREMSIDLATQPFELPSEPLVYVVRNGQYRAVDGTTVSLTLEPSDITLIAVISNDAVAQEALSKIIEAQKMANTDEALLKDAKRAFDIREFKRVTEVLENSTVTPTETERTDKPTSTPATKTKESNKPTSTPITETKESSKLTDTRATKTNRSNEATSTSATGPGFGVGEGLGTLLGAGVLARWVDRNSDSSEEVED